MGAPGCETSGRVDTFIGSPARMESQFSELAKAKKDNENGGFPGEKVENPGNEKSRGSRHGSLGKQLKSGLLIGQDSIHPGSASGTSSFQRRTTVFHFDLLRILDFFLGFAFDTITGFCHSFILDYFWMIPNSVNCFSQSILMI